MNKNSTRKKRKTTTMKHMKKFTVIATTQSSPKLNNVNWGGPIIGKINHYHHHTTPCDYFLLPLGLGLSKVLRFGPKMNTKVAFNTPTNTTHHPPSPY